MKNQQISKEKRTKIISKNQETTIKEKQEEGIGK